jgi:hypothetical protein
MCFKEGMRRLTSLLVGLFLASAVAGTAIAGNDTVFSTQQGNPSALPCLNAPHSFSGVISTTTVASTLRAKDQRGGRDLDAELSLSFRYDPYDSALPSYSGQQTLSLHVSLPSTQDSLTVPVSFNLIGSDGSAALVSGTETLSLADGHGRNLIVSISDGAWTCA